MPQLGAAALLREESAADRALLRRVDALGLRFEEALGAASESSLERALGRPEDSFEANQHARVLGQGATATGETYIVREAKDEGLEPGCRVWVSVEYRTRTRFGSTGSGGGPMCVAPTEHGPSASCGETETITVAVPARVRSVALRLSDGRTITSGVVRVAPAGGTVVGAVYAQAIPPGPPYAVSLTERDRRGRTVQVVNLRRVGRCKKERSVERGPTFIPLARGTAPGGHRFTLQGVATGIRGAPNFSVTLSEGPHAEEAELSFASPLTPKLFGWSLASECPPNAYSVIYGLLRAPGATVLVRTAAGLVPLTRVAIAPRLHAAGPLFYGVFAQPPTEVLVRRADGMTLSAESLAATNRERAEFCEGYVEP